MRKMPTPPLKETFSPRMKYDTNIRKSGVKARNGIVRLMGEAFNAFVYRIMATISKGKAIKVASQKSLFKWGISIKIRLIIKTGAANNNLAHATKYSSLDASIRLVKASLVARNIAVRRA